MPRRARMPASGGGVGRGRAGQRQERAPAEREAEDAHRRGGDEERQVPGEDEGDRPRPAMPERLHPIDDRELEGADLARQRRDEGREGGEEDQEPALDRTKRQREGAG